MPNAAKVSGSFWPTPARCRAVVAERADHEPAERKSAALASACDSRWYMPPLHAAARRVGQQREDQEEVADLRHGRARDDELDAGLPQRQQRAPQYGRGAEHAEHDRRGSQQCTGERPRSRVSTE
jgi:hypothetical protein